VRDIFGIRFLRPRPPFREGDDPAEQPDAPKRNGRRQALALVSGFVALFFVAAVQQGDPATGKVSLTTLVAVLKDPLTLFAERSPGGRAEGALLPTKPPRERVLSTIRERDPTGTLPGVDDPVVAGVPEAAGPGGPAPEERVLSGEREGFPGGGGAPGGFAPFGGAPGGLIPENFATAPPGGGGPGDPGPSNPPGILDPSNPPGVNPPGTNPPGVNPPGLLDPPGGGAPVPEPATWAMMLLGFFAIGTAIRRRKRHALTCTQ
jgi:hypothetical protein